MPTKRAASWVMVALTASCAAAPLPESQPSAPAATVPIASKPADTSVPSGSAERPVNAPPVEVVVTPDRPVAGPDGLSLKLTSVFASAEDTQPRSVEVDVALARGDQTGQLALGIAAEAPPTRSWHGFRLKLIAASDGAEEQARVQVAGRFRLAAVKRVTRDARLTLADGLDITFRRHGHKSVAAGGPPSPLIVRYVRHLPQRDEDSETRVQPDETPLFEMDGFLIELVDHDYDAWMDLRVVSTP